MPHSSIDSTSSTASTATAAVTSRFSSDTRRHVNAIQADAIIVGASIAGSVCALELANKGWQVVVLEKRQHLEHYKTLCTHIIHPAGVKLLRQYKLYPSLAEQSASATAMQISYAGMSAYFPFSGTPTAANIERQDLDPAFKQALKAHPCIDLLCGYRVSQLLTNKKRVEGLVAEDSDARQHAFSAPLVIAADGRHSPSVKLAQGQHVSQENHRVALFSYLQSDPKQGPMSRIWALDKGQQYLGIFPNQKRSLVSWYLPENEFRGLKNYQQAFDERKNFLAQQGFYLGERLEKVMVAKDTAPQRAHSRLTGFAMVGDAKLAADPLTGVGCTWAMTSGKLLARCLGNNSAKFQQSRRTMQGRIRLYNILHALCYRLPSYLMTLASMHGKWIFNRPVYRVMAWLSRVRD